MKRFTLMLIMAVPVLLYSCSGGTMVEQAEADQAAVEAEQMATALPDVDEAARRHAHALRTGAYTDSLQMHALLLDAAATRSKYEMAGQTDKARHFDEVFIRQLETENPSLAAALQK